MKIRIWSLGIVALALAASSAAFADTHVHVDVNPFGWGAPPVVYESPRYYPPPVVYYGRGRWGEHRDWRGGEHRDGRGRDHERDRSEHHDDGDRRR